MAATSKVAYDETISDRRSKYSPNHGSMIKIEGRLDFEHGRYVIGVSSYVEQYFYDAVAKLISSCPSGSRKEKSGRGNAFNL